MYRRIGIILAIMVILLMIANLRLQQFTRVTPAQNPPPLRRPFAEQAASSPPQRTVIQRNGLEFMLDTFDGQYRLTQPLACQLIGRGCDNGFRLEQQTCRAEGSVAQPPIAGTGGSSWINPYRWSLLRDVPSATTLNDAARNLRLAACHVCGLG